MRHCPKRSDGLPNGSGHAVLYLAQTAEPRTTDMTPHLNPFCGAALRRGEAWRSRVSSETIVSFVAGHGTVSGYRCPNVRRLKSEEPRTKRATKHYRHLAIDRLVRSVDGSRWPSTVASDFARCKNTAQNIQRATCAAAMVRENGLLGRTRLSIVF